MCLHRIEIHNPITRKSLMENIKKAKYTKWNTKNLNKATLPKIFWLPLKDTYLLCNIILRKVAKSFSCSTIAYIMKKDVRMLAEAVCHMPCVFLFQFPVICGWYNTYDGIFWSRVWKWSLVCVWEKQKIFSWFLCAGKQKLDHTEIVIPTLKNVFPKLF